MSGDLPGFFQGTEMPDATWWQALFPNPAQILTLVGLAPGMDAVDLCSGDGWFTLPMAKVARHVMAVDIDARMLALASSRLSQERLSNCDYQLGDAYGLAEFVPQPVDMVFMANSFHGVPDRERLARIVGGVLKPGGRFAIVNWHQLPREETTVLGQPRGPASGLRLSPEQTVKAVEAVGLRRAAIVDIPPYHYGAIFAKAP
ncbi:MAG TPA: class I SAM-dependent methyltransferase [Pseudolabrys sp.]|nr:class I SAM-dependent methyltransferase [Pseudolabrys sp.]